MGNAAEHKPDEPVVRIESPVPFCTAMEPFLPRLGGPRLLAGERLSHGWGQAHASRTELALTILQ